jgi:hypothetical protein
MASPEARLGRLHLHPDQSMESGMLSASQQRAVGLSTEWPPGTLLSLVVLLSDTSKFADVTHPGHSPLERAAGAAGHVGLVFRQLQVEMMMVSSSVPVSSTTLSLWVV